MVNVYRVTDFVILNNYPFYDSVNYLVKKTSSLRLRKPEPEACRSQRERKFVSLAEALLSLVVVDTCSVMDRQGRQTEDLFDRKPEAGFQVEQRF